MDSALRLLVWSFALTLVAVVTPATTTLSCSSPMTITNPSGPPQSTFIISGCSISGTVSISDVSRATIVSIINSNIAALSIISTNGLSLTISSCTINGVSSSFNAITLLSSNKDFALSIQQSVYTIGAAFFITDVAGNVDTVSGASPSISITETTIVVGQVQAISLQSSTNLGITLSGTSISTSATVFVSSAYPPGVLVPMSSVVSIASMTGGSVSIVNGSTVSTVLSCSGRGTVNASVLFFPSWTGTSSSSLTVSDSTLSLTQIWNQDVSFYYTFHTIFMLSMSGVSLLCQRSVLALQYTDTITSAIPQNSYQNIIPTFTFLNGTISLPFNAQSVTLQRNVLTISAVHITVDPSTGTSYGSRHDTVNVTAISSSISTGGGTGAGTSVVVASNQFLVNFTQPNQNGYSVVLWLGWAIGGNVQRVSVTNNSWTHSTMGTGYCTWFGGVFTSTFSGSLMVLGNSITAQSSRDVSSFYASVTLVDAQGVGTADGNTPAMMAFNQLVFNFSNATITTSTTAATYSALSALSLNASCAQYLPGGLLGLGYQRLVCGNAFYVNTTSGSGSLLGSNADWNKNSILQYNRLESHGSAYSQNGDMYWYYATLWLAGGRLRGGAIRHNYVVFDRLHEADFYLLSSATIDGADASQTSMMVGNVMLYANDTSSFSLDGKSSSSWGSCALIPTGFVGLSVCNNSVLATNIVSYGYGSLISSVQALSPFSVKSNTFKMYGIPYTSVNLIDSITINSFHAHLTVTDNVVVMRESSSSANVVLASISHFSGDYSELKVVGNVMLGYTNAAVAARLVPSPLPASSVLDCVGAYPSVSLVCNNTVQIYNTQSVSIMLCSGCTAKNDMTVSVERNVLIAMDSPAGTSASLETPSWRMALNFDWCSYCSITSTGTLVVKSNEARLLGLQSVSYSVVNMQVNSGALWASGNIVYATTPLVSGVTIMSPGSSLFPASMVTTLRTASGCTSDPSLFPSSFLPFPNALPTSMVCNNSLIAWQCDYLSFQLCQSCSIQSQGVALITNNAILVENVPSLYFAWCPGCYLSSSMNYPPSAANSPRLLMTGNTLSANNISTAMYLNNLFYVYLNQNSGAAGSTVSLSGNLVAVSGLLGDSNNSPSTAFAQLVQQYSSCPSFPLWDDAGTRVGIICNNTVLATRVASSVSVRWATINSNDANTDVEVRNNVAWVSDVPRADFSVGGASCSMCQRIRLFNNSCMMTNISQTLSGTLLQYVSATDTIIITGNTLLFNSAGGVPPTTTNSTTVCASSLARGICVSGNSWVLSPPTTTTTPITTPTTINVALIQGVQTYNAYNYQCAGTATVYGNQLSILANESTTSVSVVAVQQISQSCSFGSTNVNNNTVSLLLGSGNNHPKVNATYVSAVLVSGLYMYTTGATITIAQNTLLVSSTITCGGSSSLVVVAKLLSSVGSTSSYYQQYNYFISLTDNTVNVQDVNGRGSSITVRVCDQCSIFPAGSSSMQVFRNAISVTSFQNAFVDNTTASMSVCSGCNVYGRLQISANSIRVTASSSWIAFASTSVIVNAPSSEMPTLTVSDNTVTSVNASIRSEIMGCQFCTTWGWVEFTGNALWSSVQSTTSSVLLPPSTMVSVRVFLHMGTYGNVMDNSADVVLSNNPALPIDVHIDLATLPPGPLSLATGGGSSATSMPSMFLYQVMTIQGNRVYVSRQRSTSSSSDGGGGGGGSAMVSVTASMLADNNTNWTSAASAAGPPTTTTVVGPSQMFPLAIGLDVQFNSVEIDTHNATMVNNYNANTGGLVVDDIVLLRLRQTSLLSTVSITMSSNRMVITNATTIYQCGFVHIGATEMDSAITVSNNNSVATWNVTYVETTTFVSVGYLINGSLFVSGNMYSTSSLQQAATSAAIGSVSQGVVLVQVNDSSVTGTLIVQNNSIRFTGTLLNKNDTTVGSTASGYVELVYVAFAFPRTVEVYDNSIQADGDRGSITVILLISTFVAPPPDVARNVTIANNYVRVASSVDTCSIRAAGVVMRLGSQATNTTAITTTLLHLLVSDNVFICLTPRITVVTMAVCCVSPSFNVSIINNRVVTTVQKSATYTATVASIVTLRVCPLMIGLSSTCPAAVAAAAQNTAAICVTNNYATVVQFSNSSSSTSSSRVVISVEDVLAKQPQALSALVPSSTNVSSHAAAANATTCDWMAQSNRVTLVVFGDSNESTGGTGGSSVWWSYSFAAVSSIVFSGCATPKVFMFGNNFTGVTIPYYFVSLARMSSLAVSIFNTTSPVGMGSIRITIVGASTAAVQVSAQNMHIGQIYLSGTPSNTGGGGGGAGLPISVVVSDNCSVGQLSLKGTLANVNISFHGGTGLVAAQPPAAASSLQLFPIVDLTSLLLSSSVINIENATWITSTSSTSGGAVAAVSPTAAVRHSFVAMNRTLLNNVSLAVSITAAPSSGQINMSEALLVAADCVSVVSSVVTLSAASSSLVTKNVIQFSWSNATGNALLSSCASFLLPSSLAPLVVSDSMISVTHSTRMFTTSDAVSLSNVAWSNVHVDVDGGAWTLMKKSETAINTTTTSVVAFDNTSFFTNSSILFDNVTFIGYDRFLLMLLLLVDGSTPRLEATAPPPSAASAVINASNLTAYTACARWNAVHKSVMLHQTVLGPLLEHLYEPLCFSNVLDGAACPCQVSRTANVTSSLWTSSPSRSSSISSSRNHSTRTDTVSRSPVNPTQSRNELSLSKTKSRDNVTASHSKSKSVSVVPAPPPPCPSPLVVTPSSMSSSVLSNNGGAAVYVSFEIPSSINNYFLGTIWGGTAVDPRYLTWSVSTVSSGGDTFLPQASGWRLVDTTRIFCNISSSSSGGRSRARINCSLPITPGLNMMVAETVILSLSPKAFGFLCSAVEANGAFSLTPSSPSTIQTVTKVFSGIAAVAGAGAAFAGAPDAQILGALTMMSCSSSSSQESGGPLRYLISPFYDAGRIAVVYGNIGLSLLGPLIRWPLCKKYGIVSDAVMRFPSLDMAFALLLLQGVVTAASKLLFASLTATDAVTGCVGLLYSVCFLCFILRTTVQELRPQLSFLPYTHSSALGRFLLPSGFWCPPHLVSTHGSFFNNCGDKKTHMMAFANIVANLIILIAAIRPPVSACVAQIGVIGAIAWIAAGVLAWQVPYRKPFTNVLAVLSHANLGVLVVLFAIDVSSPSLSIEVAQSYVTLLQTLLVLARGSHDLITRIYETVWMRKQRSDAIFDKGGEKGGDSSGAVSGDIIAAMIGAFVGVDAGEVDTSHSKRDVDDSNEMEAAAHLDLPMMNSEDITLLALESLKLRGARLDDDDDDGGTNRNHRDDDDEDNDAPLDASGLLASFSMSGSVRRRLDDQEVIVMQDLGLSGDLGLPGPF